jgi:hypothetical protein
VSGRRQHKALARWENDTRSWAYETARDLVMAIVTGQPTPATPYRIGVVLEPRERVWAECPVRFLQERPMAPPAGHPSTPPIRPWLVTSDRILGRLGDDRLYGWRWNQIVGCRIELTAPLERVTLDLSDGSCLSWSGPGVAPLSVAAVSQLHGPSALIDHPGLAVLRPHGGRIEALQEAGGSSPSGS